MVASLNGRDGGFARFDTGDEICVVIIGGVKPDLAVIRKLGAPIEIRGVKAAAVDPNPSVCANPFCAAADVAMPPSDDHLDVVRVLKVYPVARTGVPEGIGGREFAHAALDLQRAAGLIHVQTPVADVAVVADPIQQLPTADIVIPAPVHVDSGADVWLLPRRTKPRFVVQLRRRRRYCRVPLGRAGHHLSQEVGVRALFKFRRQGPASAGKICMPARQADFDPGYLPDQVVADNFGGAAERTCERCQEPVCQIRPFCCTARTMACCSAMVRASGFSP